MIVLIRCNDIISDSRTMKYVSFYDRHHLDYKIIAWDRLGTSEKLPHTVYCPARSRYNQGGMAAVVDRIKWMWFVLKTLFSLRGDLKIHACDLDAAFPAVIYKTLTRRKTFVLFDVFDWISDTLYNQGKIVSAAFRFMELVSTRKADHVIICEPERRKQIPYDIEGRYSVLQNIPSFTTGGFLHFDKNIRFDNGKITLCYVGGFYHGRCLIELIEGAVRGVYNLNIAGYGDRTITEELERHTDSAYIRYYGKVSQADGLNIMYNSDIIYAMYSKHNPNHIYAAPNKYYETMFVGKAIITTKGIIVAGKVEADKIGYSIEESLDALADLVQSLTIDDVKQRQRRAAGLWQKYKTAVEDFLNTTYCQIMGISTLKNALPYNK